MTYTQLSCEEFVSILASNAPTPGGGGAAALVGAIGIALGNMVGALTTGKKKYADVEADIQQLIARSNALQQDFLDLVTADAAAFEPLAKAYALPKETEAEKAERARVMAIVLREACSVPLQIMHKCCEAIDVIEAFAAKGSALAISDAGCGAVCCQAALRAASFNVFINTKSMEDRTAAMALNSEALAMLDTYGAKAEAIFASVKARFF